MATAAEWQQQAEAFERLAFGTPLRIECTNSLKTERYIIAGGNQPRRRALSRQSIEAGLLLPGEWWFELQAQQAWFALLRLETDGYRIEQVDGEGEHAVVRGVIADVASECARLAWRMARRRAQCRRHGGGGGELRGLLDAVMAQHGLNADELAEELKVSRTSLYDAVSETEAAQARVTGRMRNRIESGLRELNAG